MKQEKWHRYLNQIIEASSYPHAKLANPTISPEAKIAYPPRIESAVVVCSTDCNLVWRIIATMTP